jgi:hypothetical protein
VIRRPDIKVIKQAVPMTAESPFPGLADSDTPLPGELIDALIEAVVIPPDPRSRSLVIGDLVNEICAAVEWSCSRDTTLDVAQDDELISVRQLAAATQDHQLRMRALGTDRTGLRRLPGAERLPGVSRLGRRQPRPVGRAQ